MTKRRNKQRPNTSKQDGAEAAARRACVELVKEHLRRTGTHRDPSDRDAIDYALAAVARALADKGVVLDGQSFREVVIGHAAKLLHDATGEPVSIQPDGTIVLGEAAPELTLH